MIRPQYVYRATDFIFGNGGTPKPKFFVVFHANEDLTLMLSLTTSKSKLPPDLDNENTDGCIQYFDRGYGHAFVWKPNRVIGKNGFRFDLRTSIQLEFRADLYSVSQSQIAAMASRQIVECCCLTDEEFAAVLNCLLRSRYLNPTQKKGLRDRLNALNV